MEKIENLIKKYKERKSKLKINGNICIKETQDPFAKIAIKAFDLIFSEFIKDLQKLNKPAVINQVCDTCEKCGTPKYFNYKYGEYEDCRCSQTDC